MAKKKVSGHDRAFLGAIAESPDDDGPRLVYADWLEDNGQPHRAELIRLQCRLATMQGWDPERLPLEQREADLLCVHGESWKPLLPAWARPGERRAFRRGFLDHFSVTATDLLKRGPALFAATPVSELEVRNLGDRMPQVAACPLLGRLTALDLDEEVLTPDDLRALGASPHLGNLRALAGAAPALAHLVAYNEAVTAEGLAALARCPALTSLKVWANSHGADDLAGAELTERLTSLELNRVDLTHGALATLAGGARLARLRRLSMDCLLYTSPSPRDS